MSFHYAKDGILVLQNITVPSYSYH
jgi:hypothetical protein